jgi:hypothetical protein
MLGNDQNFAELDWTGALVKNMAGAAHIILGVSI